MNEDFISKDVLYKIVELSMLDNPHKDGKIRVNHNNEHQHFMNMIYHTPSANVEPIINAFWKKRTHTHSDGSSSYWYACSNCDTDVPKDRYGHDYFSRRCPHCGAHMDFESEDTEE